MTGELFFISMALVSAFIIWWVGMLEIKQRKPIPWSILFNWAMFSIIFVCISLYPWG